jgi:hypothetical protein
MVKERESTLPPKSILKGSKLYNKQRSASTEQNKPEVKSNVQPTETWQKRFNTHISKGLDSSPEPEGKEEKEERDKAWEKELNKLLREVLDSSPEPEK